MSWLNVFLRPWAVAIAWVCTVASLAFGIWTYVDSKASRRLTLSVDSPATQIVKAGQSSGLSVNFNGQALSSDVSAGQFVFWNAGKLAIKKDEVLKPVTLVMDGGAPILEASIRARSREVTEAALDKTEIGKGRLGINWRILEQSDGVRIQFIYAGGLNAKSHIEGIIEGQGVVKVQEVDSLFQTVTWARGLVVAAILLVVLQGTEKLSNSVTERDPRWLALLKIMPVLIMLGVIVWLYLGFLNARLHEDRPPASLLSTASTEGRVTPAPFSG